MRRGLEGQKAYLAGEISKLKAQVVEEKRKRVQNLIARWTMHSLEPTFKAWKQHTSDRKLHRQNIMTKMLSRLEQAGAWVSF